MSSADDIREQYIEEIRNTCKTLSVDSLQLLQKKIKYLIDDENRPTVPLPTKYDTVLCMVNKIFEKLERPPIDSLYAFVKVSKDDLQKASADDTLIADLHNILVPVFSTQQLEWGGKLNINKNRCLYILKRACKVIGIQVEPTAIRRKHNGVCENSTYYTLV